MADVNLALTEAGQALMAKIQMGAGTLPLEITRIVTSSGTDPDPLGLTELSHEELEFSITSRATNGARTTVGAYMNNFGPPSLAQGYPLAQIGIYATDPDEGEILMRVSQFDNPNYVPAATERAWEYELTFNFVTGNASEVVINIDPAGLATIDGVNNAIQAATANLVEKAPGKGLSTNDYTTADKNKVALIDTVTADIDTITGEIDTITADVAGLLGKSTRYAVTLPGNPTQDDLTLLYQTASGRTDDPPDATRLVDVALNLMWTWFSSDGLWHGPESDTVTLASNTSPGIVRGSTEAGKVTVEPDGTMTVNGGAGGGVRVELDVSCEGISGDDIPVAGETLRITDLETRTFERYVVDSDNKVSDSLAFLRKFSAQIELEESLSLPVYFETGWRAGKIDVDARFRSLLGWYGVEWDVTATSPAMTRIAVGDQFALHAALPVQSLMKGALLADGGTVTKYLDAEDWSGETLDGSAGQVMVELPEHWRKFETEGNIRRAKIALGEFEGAHRVPKRYVSAYEAMADSGAVSASTKLCSVVNTGSNSGKPLVNTTLTNFRNYARNRGNGAKWNCFTYPIRDELAWLFYIEYAHRDSQAAFNAEKTPEGYSRGGLGGVPAGYNTVPCGQTNEYGNRAIAVTKGSYGNCYRYRGVEFPFGHNWHWTDGILFNNAGVYVCTDPSKFGDTVTSDYVNVGTAATTNNAFIRDILFGDQGYIIPTNVSGGSASTYWTDNYWYTSGLRGLLFGAYAADGAGCGFAATTANSAPSYSSANVGSRLCFLPESA